MDPSTIFDGKVYVFHIKGSASKDWEHPDVMYGLGHEGLDGLSFCNFRTMSNENGKLFLSKKANKEGAGSCTWAEICTTLDDWCKMGDPKLVFLDKPISWYKLATIA